MSWKNHGPRYMRSYISGHTGVRMSKNLDVLFLGTRQNEDSYSHRGSLLGALVCGNLYICATHRLIGFQRV